jgi:hypothetical protein
MYKKRFLAGGFYAAFVLLCSGLFAYNPPIGGENLLRYGHADLTSQTTSAAGGSIFSATPQSVVINPALIAGIQRVSIDAGYTGLFPTKDSKNNPGAGIQLGLVIPTRWGVAAGMLHGAFIPVESMTLGNTFAGRAAFARDITDDFYVGASLFGGVNTGEGTDWALGLDIGAWYRFGTVGSLQDFRVGFSLVNLGKTFAIDVPGIASGDSDFFPGMVTPRVGLAANFLNQEKITAGFSIDLSAPFFQNAIVDAGAQICFADIVTVSAGWQFNLMETVKEHNSLIPSVGVSVKFMVNTAKSEFMSSKGWNTSDIVTSTNWRQIYDGIQQISVGVTANLGLKDTEGPVISLWEE